MYRSTETFEISEITEQDPNELPPLIGSFKLISNTTGRLAAIVSPEELLTKYEEVIQE